MAPNKYFIAHLEGAKQVVQVVPVHVARRVALGVVDLVETLRRGARVSLLGNCTPPYYSNHKVQYLLVLA